MDFTGTWHIFEMEIWGEDYFNMEVQAYIEINSSMLGNFQFGLVKADINEVNYEDEERLEFTWEGNEENDPMSGSGCLKMIDNDLLEGEFRIQKGDSSRFRARRGRRRLFNNNT